MICIQIEEKLKSAFEPIYIKVYNESYKHNVPAGSASHFKVVIVSEQFIGQRLLVRHRSIYSELANEISEHIHALSLHTYTLKEWQALQDTSLISPNCLNFNNTLITKY
ncbi:MAG: transcriptional regulator BolA [Pantoea sp. Brub]|nr:transcriptional regulator BolA [Pantoea sp. Brub]